MKNIIVAFLLVFSFSVSFANWFNDVESQHSKTVNSEVTGASKTSGSVVRVPDVTSYSALESDDAINPYGKHFVVINGTGVITLSATPTVSTTPAIAGQELVIMGGSNAVTFQDNDTLSGSLLELGNTTRELSTGKILSLIYYSGKWYESFSSQGAIGATGSVGATGSTGATGAVGATGATGATGA